VEIDNAIVTAFAARVGKYKLYNYHQNINTVICNITDIDIRKQIKNAPFPNVRYYRENWWINVQW